ncbi:MAG TPA: DUF5715 family protein [Gemmatimonadaceae bacterium]|nr:DUF5715 family protein [Gemmatimonadaceae bacterium]
MGNPSFSSVGRLVGLAALVALVVPSAGRAQTLRGSQEAVDATYDFARDRKLTFHRTSRTVRRAAARGEFVRLAGSRDVQVKGVTFPYVLPATRTFVMRLGSEYRSVCGEPLTVTSAVRPSTRQPRNAAAKSVHPTGIAIDLRKPRGRDCRDWLRDRLLELERDGSVDATEEFHPPHFHVVVYSPALYPSADASTATSGTSQR